MSKLNNIKKPFFLSFAALLVMSAAFVIVYPYQDNDRNITANKPAISAALPVSDTIVISAVGDCTLGSDSKSYAPRTLPALVKRNNDDLNILFNNVKDIFSKDDITIANLETTFAVHDLKVEKEYNFKGPSYLAGALPLASIEGVNISNNHIYDFGIQGFNDTRDVLTSYKINYFGENSKWETKAKGTGIGFLGYRGWNLSKELIQKLKSDIADLKSRNKIVIVNFHWGDEMETSPDYIQRKIGRYAIDFGADAVIGHHPHVIQGIEKYKQGYICYSLANFCFGGNSNPKDKDTFIFQMRFVINDSFMKSFSVRALPCSVSSKKNINDYCPTPLIDDEKSRVMQKINDRSSEFGFIINDNFRD